jgi:hypothetical protein
MTGITYSKYVCIILIKTTIHDGEVKNSLINNKKKIKKVSMDFKTI